MIKTITLLLITTTAIPQEKLLRSEKILMMLPEKPCGQLWDVTAVKEPFSMSEGRIELTCTSKAGTHERVYRL